MLTKNYIKLAIPAGLGVIALVATTIVLVPDDAKDRLLRGAQSSQSTGSAVDALDGDHGMDIDAEEPERPVYEGPTSAYIEEGFDPDVAELDMGGPATSQANSELPSRLSNQQIQRVFRDHQTELLRCYGTALAHDRSLSGAVEFDFAVHPEGRVAMVKIADSSLHSTEAEDCFVDKARHWAFPQTSQDLPTRFQMSMTFQY